jgi:large subunit ribosomal protein L28
MHNKNFFEKKAKKHLHFDFESGIIESVSLFKEVQPIMAKCEFCGKGVTFGIKVSHSHRRSNRTWKPNVKRVKAIVKGTPCHVYVCSRCLRSGKVERA